MEEKFALFLTNWKYVYAISGTLILSYVLRQYFNLRKKGDVNHIEVDYFIACDLVYAISSACLFTYISSLDYTVMLDVERKNSIDYMVAVIIMMAYLRLFMLFLVIPSVSVMMLTLIAMLKDVTHFTALMVCYVIFAMQVFQTLF